MIKGGVIQAASANGGIKNCHPLAGKRFWNENRSSFIKYD
jgi:hypothetical protein